MRVGVFFRFGQPGHDQPGGDALAQPPAIKIKLGEKAAQQFGHIFNTQSGPEKISAIDEEAFPYKDHAQGQAFRRLGHADKIQSALAAKHDRLTFQGAL